MHSLTSLLPLKKPGIFLDISYFGIQKWLLFVINHRGGCFRRYQQFSEPVWNHKSGGRKEHGIGSNCLHKWKGLISPGLWSFAEGVRGKMGERKWQQDRERGRWVLLKFSQEWSKLSTSLKLTMLYSLLLLCLSPSLPLPPPSLPVACCLAGWSVFTSSLQEVLTNHERLQIRPPLCPLVLSLSLFLSLSLSLPQHKLSKNSLPRCFFFFACGSTFAVMCQGARKDLSITSGAHTSTWAGEHTHFRLRIYTPYIQLSLIDHVCRQAVGNRSRAGHFRLIAKSHRPVSQTGL